MTKISCYLVGRDGGRVVEYMVAYFFVLGVVYFLLRLRDGLFACSPGWRAGLNH